MRSPASAGTRCFRSSPRFWWPLAIWVYVDVDEGHRSEPKTIRDIPVEFSGESTTLADKNLMLLSGYDTTVDLTIKGTKRELVKINKDNVRLVASTSSIDSVGVHTLRWDVVYPDGVQSSALSVDWASKYKVTVTVGELYTKEVPVNCVVTGTVADGYFTGETVLDPTTLVLRGQRDDLLNVAYAKLTVDISDATRSVIQTESVQLYDNDDNPVDNSNIRTNASLIQAEGAGADHQGGLAGGGAVRRAGLGRTEHQDHHYAQQCAAHRRSRCAGEHRSRSCWPRCISRIWTSGSRTAMW